MKITAAKAIAGLVSNEELADEYIIVKTFDPRISEAVAKAVYNAAVDSNVARV